MSYIIEAGYEWPKDRNGDPKATTKHPVLGIEICRDCWNGAHPRKGCNIHGCQCKCYEGRNKGLTAPRVPHRSCKENQEFPDVGSFKI